MPSCARENTDRTTQARVHRVGQVVICDVNDFELCIVALFRDVVNHLATASLLRPGRVLPVTNCDLKHSISLL